MRDDINLGSTVRLRWGKRIAVVTGIIGEMVQLDRKLGGQILWNRNDLVEVPKS